MRPRKGEAVWGWGVGGARSFLDVPPAHCRIGQDEVGRSAGVGGPG